MDAWTRRWGAWIVAAVIAAGWPAPDAVVRADDPCCCGYPCRLLDPLGQDPLWTGRVDALLLWRDAPQAVPLYDFSNGSGVALTAADFQTGMAAGPRFALFRHTGDMGAIELNYLLVKSFSATESLPDELKAYRDAAPRGLYCCNDNVRRDAAGGHLSSSLQSAEVNRRFPTDGRLGWLMGFRWVEWDESLGLESRSFTTSKNPLTNSYLTETDNDLYGLQIGADSILFGLGRSFRLEGIGKAGIYYNDARQSSRFTSTDTGTLAVNTDVGRAAFFGEVGATAVYDITDRLSFRTGYTIFWLGGLALAPAQYEVNKLCADNPIEGATDTSGSVVVQGLSLGLEYRW